MITALTPSATLLEQTYRAILSAICDGTLAPGEKLTQERVAERLNVSRQPVAQALALLKTQGFVQETGRRGLAVSHLDPVFFGARNKMILLKQPECGKELAALWWLE